MPSTITSTAFSYRWQILSTAFLLSLVARAVYRLFFHPLAKVPGPPLAAITKLYQSYYNRKYYEQIDKLHQIYGPVVRINPDEVHLSDPDNYDKIYFIGSKYSKGTNYYASTSVPYSTFGAISNEAHRLRRGAINPMFSRKMVLDMEAVVQDKAQQLCNRIQKAIDSSEPCDLHHGFRAVSIDVISDFSFNRSFGLLETQDCGARFFELTGGVGPSLWLFQQFPSIQKLSLKMPPWIAPYLSSALGKVMELQEECVKQVVEVRGLLESGKYDQRATIFSTLLSPTNKPEGYQIPPTHHLKDEAFSIIMAAADTTGNAMTVAMFHALRDPEIYKTLTKELTDKFPNADAELPFIELEKLPYLTAVIKEGLRLSFGVPGRLPRHVPDGGATFNGHFIPAGYLVGMSSWTQHRDPTVFPDPMKFDPGRWLDPATFWARDHHIVPFSKGTRQCVGMPLAYAELYVTLGTVFRRFPRLRVWKTDVWDMEYVDYFSSYHIRGRNWLKVVEGEEGES